MSWDAYLKDLNAEAWARLGAELAGVEVRDDLTLTLGDEQVVYLPDAGYAYVVNPSDAAMRALLDAAELVGARVEGDDLMDVVRDPDADAGYRLVDRELEDDAPPEAAPASLGRLTLLAFPRAGFELDDCEQLPKGPVLAAWDGPGWEPAESEWEHAARHVASGGVFAWVSGEVTVEDADEAVGRAALELASQLHGPRDRIDSFRPWHAVVLLDGERLLHLQDGQLKTTTKPRHLEPACFAEREAFLASRRAAWNDPPDPRDLPPKQPWWKKLFGL